MINQITFLEANKVIKDTNPSLIIFTKEGCPNCDYFIPNIIMPNIMLYEMRGVKFYEVVYNAKDMPFGPEAFPSVYLYQSGDKFHWFEGTMPSDIYDAMMEDFINWEEFKENNK